MPKMRGARKKKKEEAIILTPEEKYEELLKLKDATGCILRKKDEYEVYLYLAKEFQELVKTPEAETFAGIETCSDLSEECRQMAEQMKGELPAQLEEVSRTVTTTAREQAKQNPGKKSRGKWVVLAVAVLVVAAAICYKVTPTRYQIAGLEDRIGLHRYAMESYAKLGDYKDSRERERLQADAYGTQLQEKGELEGARKQFSRLADSGDMEAAEKEVQIEKTLLASAEPGSVVVFGKCRWIVLEKKDGGILLARFLVLRDKKSDKGTVWSRETFASSAQETPWEDSPLREYLNGEFIEKEFTEKEAACLKETNLENKSNSLYGTVAGKDTKDRVFIFSEQEILPYLEILGEKAKSIRLRTPGRDLTATAYVSNQCEVVPFGFPVEQKGIYNRPVIWVEYE